MSKNSFLHLLIFLFFSHVLFASEKEPVIDLELGEEINEVCAGCHGEFGEGGKDGEYPRIAGFPAKYLVEQLLLYKSNERLNIPMKPYANERELPDDDIYSVTAYLETIKLRSVMPDFPEGMSAYDKLLIAKQVINIPRAPGDIEKGRVLYDKDCKICHGKDGKGKKGSDVPPVAGQYTRYLKKQIKDYNAKLRHHDYDDDDEAFKGYSEQELQDILAFLSVADDVE